VAREKAGRVTSPEAKLSPPSALTGEPGSRQGDPPGVQKASQALALVVHSVMPPPAPPV
jgi:hypothetical protein